MSVETTYDKCHAALIAISYDPGTASAEYDALLKDPSFSKACNEQFPGVATPVTAVAIEQRLGQLIEGFWSEHSKQQELEEQRQQKEAKTKIVRCYEAARAEFDKTINEVRGLGSEEAIKQAASRAMDSLEDTLADRDLQDPLANRKLRVILNRIDGYPRQVSTGSLATFTERQIREGYSCEQAIAFADKIKKEIDAVE